MRSFMQGPGQLHSFSVSTVLQHQVVSSPIYCFVFMFDPTMGAKRWLPAEILPVNCMYEDELYTKNKQKLFTSSDMLMFFLLYCRLLCKRCI